MSLYLEEVEGWHVAELAYNLRQADIDEIQAMAGCGPLRGLGESVAWSDVAYSIMEDEKPVAMYGARKATEDVGVVWMLASPAIERCSIQFLKHSIEYTNRLHDETGCKILANYTDKRNKLHHKWLRWTGFKFGREVPYGPYQMPFYEITRVRETCVD